jgi:hypothetical protein
MINLLIAQSSGEAGFDLGEAYTLRDGTPVKDVFSTPADLVNLIVPNLFVIGAVAVLFLIILGGYKYLAQGSKGAQEAGKIWTNAFFGLVVMFIAYWIVQIIKAITGADIPL